MSDIELIKPSAESRGYNGRRVYCENCDEETEYRILSAMVTKSFQGVTFTYPESEAVCKKCGQPVYIGFVNDWNVAERANAYARAKARQ